MNKYILYHIFGIFVLLCCSFFFSCTETTLFSLSSFKVKKLQREHKHRGPLIARLLANPRRLLISILIGNMFVNILASTLGESLMRHLHPGAEGTIFAIFIMSFAILVMGEVTPKTIAIQCNERFAPLVAPVINFIGIIQYPLRKLVRSISDAIIEAFSRRAPSPELAITEDEIKTAIRIGSREGIVDSHEKKMIQGVFDFANKRVGAIMRPRKDIVAFEINHEIKDIAAVIREQEYSRIPIYEKNLDNIVGILFAKDILAALVKGGTVELRPLLRPVSFIPETKTASSTFREFRKHKTHLAIVVDEYGGVSGLITLEDLIEEIIGEIRDKGESGLLYQKLNEGRYRINTRMEISEFNALMGSEITDRQHATIGGFLVGQIGKIPPVGHALTRGGLTFTVTAANRNSIEEIIAERGGKP